MPRVARTTVARSSGGRTLIRATDSVDSSLYDGARLVLHLGAPPGPRRSDSSARTWRVSSPIGQPLGQLDLPAHEDPVIPGNTRPLDVRRDRIALLREGESGEPEVEVRRIVR